MSELIIHPSSSLTGNLTTLSKQASYAAAVVMNLDLFFLFYCFLNFSNFILSLSLFFYLLCLNQYFKQHIVITMQHQPGRVRIPSVASNDCRASLIESACLLSFACVARVSSHAITSVPYTHECVHTPLITHALQEILVYVELLETRRQYLCNLTPLWSAAPLLLCATSLDTNK